MTSRQWSMMLRALVICGVVLSFSDRVTAEPASSRPPERPNVLLITVDDLNDWIGPLAGHPQSVTPHIDRLASRAVTFTNAHCQAPICKPSRDSFMTGRLPSTTGIYTLGGFHFRKAPALADAVTLPEAFARAGYDTVGCGKVYHNSTSMGTFATYGPSGGFGPTPKQKINHPIGHPLWDWGPFPDRDEQLPDHAVASYAVEQFKQPRDKPLFLAVGFCRPHVPMYVPQKWFDAVGPEADIKLPATLDTDRDDLSDWAKRLTYGSAAPRHQWIVEHNQWRKAVHAYLACVRYVDSEIGRVLDALDASPMRDNTVVVLLSDHGFHLGEKFRWCKRSLWEEATRVPLIIAAPSMARGVRCGQPAGLIDVYPTLAELCGVTPDPRLEGLSLVPQLRDPAAHRDRPALTTFWVNNHAVRSQRWRYIRYSDGSQELYDHDADPNEWRNLAAPVPGVDPAIAPGILPSIDPQHAAVIADLARWLPTVNAPPMPGSSQLDVAEEDRAAFGADN